MWSILVAGMLIQSTFHGGPESQELHRFASEEEISRLSTQLQTGTLIFSQGDCLAVKIFSGSSYTHVGGVVIEDDGPYVFDSMNGKGVRKTRFENYLRLQTPSEIHVVHPTKAFTPERAGAFRKHLEGQIGRKYAIKHFLTGNRCDGLHCAEYMTDALMCAEVIRAKNPPRVSPGSLLEGLEKPRLYDDGGHYVLKEVQPQRPANQSWCQRLWYDTGTCCTSTATQLSRWLLCR